MPAINSYLQLYFYIGGGLYVPSFHTSGYDFTDSIMENAVEMFKSLIEE
jgi:hypothetical protein